MNGEREGERKIGRQRERGGGGGEGEGMSKGVRGIDEGKGEREGEKG